MVESGVSEPVRGPIRHRWGPMMQPREFPETRASLLMTMRDSGPCQVAWREFYDRYAPAIFRIARLRGFAEHEAEDVVQQVMVVIAKHIDHFDYDTSRGRFRHWVQRVTENKIVDLYRRRLRESREEASLDDRPDGRPQVDEAWAQAWEVQDMLWCLDGVAEDISPRRLQAFRLYVLEGVSAEETARRLGLTKAHVYVIRNIVINLIRQRMQDLEQED